MNTTMKTHDEGKKPLMRATQAEVGPQHKKAPVSLKTGRVFGWHRDRFIPSNLKFLHETLTLDQLTATPKDADLRGKMEPVFDQGQLGSCTANAIAGAVEFKNPASQKYVPSRLFIYWNERNIQGTISSDSGSSISTGVQAITQYGAPPETDWVYDEAQFATKPPQKAYTDALRDILKNRKHCVNLNQIKYQVGVNRTPVCFGFEVYSSFESDAVAQNGVVPMPTENDTYLGGHAVSVVGYDDAAQVVICRNSWGSSWGMAGYFSMPYAYIETPSLASDFWAFNSLT